MEPRIQYAQTKDGVSIDGVTETPANRVAWNGAPPPISRALAGQDCAA